MRSHCITQETLRVASVFLAKTIDGKHNPAAYRKKQYVGLDGGLEKAENQLKSILISRLRQIYSN